MPFYITLYFIFLFTSDCVQYMQRHSTAVRNCHDIKSDMLFIYDIPSIIIGICIHEFKTPQIVSNKHLKRDVINLSAP